LLIKPDEVGGGISVCTLKIDQLLSAKLKLSFFWSWTHLQSNYSPPRRCAESRWT